MYNEAELSVFGLPFNVRDIPKRYQEDWFVSFAADLMRASEWSSTGYSRTVQFRLCGLTNILLNPLQIADTEYVCPVPIGLPIRLLTLIALLWDENSDAIHVGDPDFYGRDDGSAPEPSEPFYTLARSYKTSNDFWDALDSVRKQHSHLLTPATTIHWSIVFDSVLFCAFHESVHVLRRHREVIDLADNKKETRKGAEVDADHRAGFWLGLTNVNGAIDRGSAQLWETTWSTIYAICLAFGIFDIERRSFGSFLGDDTYHHPTARVMIAINGVIQGTLNALEQVGSKREIPVSRADLEVIKKELEEQANDVVRRYTGNVNDLWKAIGLDKTRPSVLYFPFIPEETEAERMPFLKTFLSMLPIQITPRSILKSAYDDFTRFNTQHEELFKATSL